MKDAKYLLAYITPLTAFLGLYFAGIWSLGSVYIGFLMIPLLELVLPQSTANWPPEEEASRSKSLFFDLLLYLNIPFLYGILWYFFSLVQGGNLSQWELIAMLLNMGLLLGAMGINIAHELGHRKEWYNQLAAHLLLLPNLYLHFNIEHNHGHHKNVATDEDPASSRLGESFYAFWLRSVSGSYRNAWAIEKQGLKKTGRAFWSINNKMLIFQLVQLIYLLFIGLLFGWKIVLIAIIIAIGGFTLLESVNYIEHYGLRRKRLASGRYETVGPHHSWNSNHELGRILLYELTRHSDHHFKATRKYQVLRYIEDSPQMPYGYPASMVVALFPPIWFKLMNPEVEKWKVQFGYK